MKLRSIFFTLFFACTLIVYDATAIIISNGNGNWNSATSWLVNGVPGFPMSGDTIMIRTGDVITITSQVTYTGLPIRITIAGTLQFTNGNKLAPPCNSYLDILDGGMIIKSTSGGGNSTLISICNITYWNAGMGPLTGPVFLAVNLLYFNADFNGKEVDLSWATASETNNDYFIVQRSTDNLNYEDMTALHGSENSTVTSYYSAIDKNTVTGLYYYRLCQVDFDGTRTYYDPQVVSINGKGNIVIYPNPSTPENLAILYDGAKETFCDIEISDISGKTIMKKENLKLNSGPNKLGLHENPDLKTGMYIISVRKSNQVYRKMIVMMK